MINALHLLWIVPLSGGAGTMAAQTVLGVDSLAAYVSISANTYSLGAEGYYFTGRTDSDTGDMSYYGLVIDGEWKDRFGAFGNDSIYFPVPYGTTIIVDAGDSSKNEKSYISWNRERVTDKANFATY